MSYNPDILDDILQTRALSRSQLSERLGVSSDKLNEELNRKPQPKHTLLNKIARELSVPEFVFYMKNSPTLHDSLPDFRTPQQQATPKSKATVESIQWAEGIQRLLSENNGKPLYALPYLSPNLNQKIDDFALEARQFFGITPSDQTDAKDSKAFYLLCRKKIEDHQILVLQDSFPTEDGAGYCIWSPIHPIIVINTQRQRSSRRLFTLLHELAHVLMHQSGISDPFISRNSIERLCNRFAASFLLPRAYLDVLLRGLEISNTPTPSEIARIASRLNISQQAAILQLERLGQVAKGSHDQWLSYVQMHGNPDFKKEGGGGNQPPPQEKVKLARFGFAFANAVSKLIRDARVTPIDLYRASGLKPKYQNSYLDFVRELSSPVVLRNLELDDD